MMQTSIKQFDYGPLTALIGTWKGDKGLDVSPEIEGEERNIYFEQITFTALGDLTNAEEQELLVLHYHHVVIRQNDGKMIHNECGYFSWDAANQLLMKSFAIPRGVALVAGGKISKANGLVKFEVEAAVDHPQWVIAQSPFMRQKALTKSYAFSMSVQGTELNYLQTMQLNIFGRSFTHQDQNQLSKVVNAD